MAYNVHQKIVEVRKVAEGFTKDTQGYQYSYVSGNQILSKIKDRMNELNLLLIPSIPEETPLIRLDEFDTENYGKVKHNREWTVAGKMTYTWVDADNPKDTCPATWYFFGQQDDVSKAFGSALTYSERYFLLKALGLPTDELDPDAKQEPKHEPKEVKYEAAKTATPETVAKHVKTEKFDPMKEFGGKEIKTDTISEAQRKLLFVKMKERVGAERAEEELKRTIGTYGYTTTSEIQKSKMNEILKDIEDLPF